MDGGSRAVVKEVIIPEPTVPPEGAFARRELPAGELHLWHADLDLGAPDASVLSADERERAARMQGRAAPRFVRSREILRRLLAAYTGEDAAALNVEVAGEGKPRLHGFDVRFNIAHSGNVWLAAFARGRDVGVDVERLDRDVDRDRVAQRIFAPREVETIRRLHGDAKTRAFFRCWTVREAIVKARGEGMFTLAARFEIDADPEHPLAVRAADPAAFGWWVAETPPATGCVAAVAADRAPRVVRALHV